MEASVTETEVDLQLLGITGGPALTMLRRDSPFGNDTNSYTGSIQSNVYSSAVDDVSSQTSNVSRPSAKSIYLQRKEYAVSVNKMMDKYQYRVEHLFTCDLDGKELRNVADCVERLKLLDGMGRVWGQNMMLAVRGVNLLLTDTDTKEELESLALIDIVELKAVLNAGPFSSLLTLSVQPGRRKTTTVFMFQCEDVRADLVQKDLSQAVKRRRENANFDSSGVTEEEENAAKAAEEEEEVQEPELLVRHEEEEEEASPFREEVPLSQLSSTEEGPPRPYTELDRDVDILNHIVSDIEFFMEQVAAAIAKNSKKKKKKKGKVMDGMPPAEEFAECLRKIKSGFNLLGELNGQIRNPSAPEFVHAIFSSLTYVTRQCHEDLPQTIVAPLLTPQCFRLLSEEASAEEDQLWQSLGDAWNIPSTQWPEDDEDIPTYTLTFSDGWQPPEVSAPALSEPVSRQESPQPAPGQAPVNAPSQPRPQKARKGESKPRHMQVMFDFVKRNPKELSVTKGEIVELLDMSKQWWKVRNSRGEEGFVPNNVLTAHFDDQPDKDTVGSPVLTKMSRPPEVKAWLEDQGFSKITVRCLGGLSGPSLLGMSREELKVVCPEEGGRVFLQLQAVKATLAAAS